MTKLLAPTGKLSAALLALCLALSACSGAAPSPGSEALSPPSADAEGSDDANEAGRKGDGSDRQGAGPDDGNGSQGAGSSGPGPAGGVALPSRSRPGVSSVRDPIGDPEGDGDVPSWVDVTGAVLRDDGGALVATASFTSALPRRMPDENHVAQVALHLQLPRENAYLYAEGRPDGWKAYFSRKKKATELPPGSFSIEGREMSWSVPWASLGDPKRLDWALHLSWTQTTLLRVNYAFDSTPDSGTERFRRR